MRVRGLFAVAALLAAGLGCGIGEPGLEECSPGGAEETAAKRIAVDFDASLHELIQCGQLTTAFARAIIETAVVIFDQGALPPDAWTHQGGGVYRTTGEGVVMDIGLVRGKDTPGGGVGTSLGGDVFSLDAWLVGASVSNDGDDLVIDFTEPGPLAALLGQGNAPASPVRLTPDDLQTVALNLATIELDGTITVDDPRGETTVSWQVIDAGGAVGDVSATGAVDVSKVKDGWATRDPQELTVATWDVVYVDPSSLNGVVAAEVVGGSFDYEVRIDFPPGGSKQITYTCL